MADPVTDPALLQQLNAPEQAAPVAPVTDPAILQQLNAPDNSTVSGVDTMQGMNMEQAKSLPTVPIEGAKGIPIAGAFIPPTPDVTKFEKEQPGLAAGARAVGGAAAMAPLMIAAPEVFGMNAAAPLLTNAATGAATGATISAADAAARGEPILSNAVTGALTGGAVPVAGKAIGAAFQGVLNWLGPEAQGVLKGFDTKALGWAADAAKADGLTDQQIAGMIKEKGPEAFLSEYSPRMKGLASGVASLPGAPEGKAAVLGGIEQRAAPEAVRGRIEQGINDMLGPPQNLTQMTLEGIEQRGKDAGPLFEQFKSTQVQPTPEIKALTDDLEQKVPGVFDDAQNLANLRSTATGREISPMKNFFTTGERKDYPTTESWQLVKEALDDRIAKSYVNGQPSKITGPLVQIKQRLDEAISNANPEAAKVWQEARDTWSSQTSIMNARDSGTKAWDPNYTKDQMLEDLTNLSTPERAAYKEGARAALAERMNRSVNGDTSIRNMMLAPANKAKMTILAQKKGVDPETFLKQMEQEKGYAQTKTDIGTNTQRQANQEMQGKLTPNPQDLPINKIPHLYSPHVTPFRYIPGVGAAGKAFARGQERAYETGRNSLGTLLSKKGPEAQDIARALLNYNPRQGAQLGMNAAGIARALAQPQLPGSPVPLLPPWAGGTRPQ